MAPSVPRSLAVFAATDPQALGRGGQVADEDASSRDAVRGAGRKAFQATSDPGVQRPRRTVGPLRRKPKKRKHLYQDLPRGVYK